MLVFDFNKFNVVFCFLKNLLNKYLLRLNNVNYFGLLFVFKNVLNRFGIIFCFLIVFVVFGFM